MPALRRGRRRGPSIAAGAISSLWRGHRRGVYIGVALVTIAIVLLAVVGLSRHADPPGRIAPRGGRELLAEKRAPAPELQEQFRHQKERREAVEPPRTYRVGSRPGGWALPGMIGVSMLGALLCAFAVKSEWRRLRDVSANSQGSIHPSLMSRLGSVGAALCFALTAALAIVLANQSPVLEPLPAIPVVDRGNIDQLRREASALKERLSVLDDRVASVE
jgi:hypothetical protein